MIVLRPSQTSRKICNSRRSRSHQSRLAFSQAPRNQSDVTVAPFYTWSGKPPSAGRDWTLSARFLKTRSCAAQQQSATSMTNDCQKRGVRMTGPQKVMIWLDRCTSYGGCLWFCGFRPSNRRLFPLFLSPSSLTLSPSLSLCLPRARSLSTNSYYCVRASSISRCAAVYDLLNDSDTFSTRMA